MLTLVSATSASSVRPSPSPSPQQAARYTLDGAPVTLDELLVVNDFEPKEVAEITALAPGQSMPLGGRATPTFTLTRVDDQPDFGAWSNAMRFALIERLLKSLADEPKCPAPVVQVARMLLGRVRFAGYEAAISDERVLGVRVDERAPVVRWVLAIVLVEQISASWDEDEVVDSQIGASFDEVLHEMGSVNAATLLKIGGAR